MNKLLMISMLGIGLSTSALAQNYPNQNWQDRDRPPMNNNNNNWDRHDDNRWNNGNNGRDNNWNNDRDRRDNRWGNDRWDGRWRGNYDQNDRNHWQQGRWQRGRHNGIDGWWWIVGGIWYYYTQPVYPYPAMGVPPTLYQPGMNYSNVRYYCPVARNYYPYVTACPVPWQRR